MYKVIRQNKQHDIHLYILQVVLFIKVIDNLFCVNNYLFVISSFICIAK